MNLSEKIHTNRGTQYFTYLGRFIYFLGLPYIWIEDGSQFRFEKLFKSYKYVSNVIIIIFIFMEWGAFFTQDNMSPKQRLDLNFFGFSQPLQYTFILSIHKYEDQIRQLIFNMVVVVKQTYNDEEVEKLMIRKMKLYSTTFSCIFIMALFLYGIDALVQVLCKGKIAQKTLPVIRQL